MDLNDILIDAKSKYASTNGQQPIYNVNWNVMSEN